MPDSLSLIHILTGENGENGHIDWAYVEGDPVNTGFFNWRAGVYLESGQTIHFKPEDENYTVPVSPSLA